MKKIFYSIVVLVVLFEIASCSHKSSDLLAGGNDSTGTGGGGTGSGNGGGTGGGSGPGGGVNNCDPNLVYFNQQVLPILISNCTMSGCHDETSRRDGVILTSYENVMRTAEVRPGQPNNSELYEVLVETDPEDRMPYRRDPLPQAQIALIRKWIEQGAKNLSCQSNCDTTTVTFNATIKNIVSAKCAGCHGGSAPAGGFDFTTYAGVKAKINDGRLWGAINHLPGFSPMPKNGQKLSDCEIAQFKKWINSGAPNN